MLDYKSGRYYLESTPLFIAAVEYQYYRDRKENWQSRLKIIKESHANTINFYIPWRHHWIDGKHDFSGKTKDNRDLKSFMQLCEQLDFYMIAKPGPFVHSELNIGGLPDTTSPSFNSEINPVLKSDGTPCIWDYDNTILPSPMDPKFDTMVKNWLQEVHDVLQDHIYPKGKIIGIQLNDETIYCTSNEKPWNFGYDNDDLQLFREILQDKYENIEAYNEFHQQNYSSFQQVIPPQLPSVKQPISSTAQMLIYIDWAEYQWRLRRDAYLRYKNYLNIDLPHITNFAGITPPIEENVPGKDSSITQDDFTALYSEWWFAMNRIEADLDVHEYGMISWLGVAAYDIGDTKSQSRNNNCSDNQVFNRYINTARRRRGINVEENWGFAKLYHPFSQYGTIPFFQTLTSIAGGCTGYVVFCGVQHDYWDNSLDSVTKQQHPTFPSDAPITKDGQTTPMYDTMKMMNKWFQKEGTNYLKCEQEHDICWLIYAPYAAVSSWIPNEKYWNLGQDIPRCGVNGLEPFSMTVQKHGYAHEMLEVTAVSQEILNSRKICALRLSFFMDEATQNKILSFVKSGGTLICCGVLPELDNNMQPLDILKKHIKKGITNLEKGKIYYSEQEIFSDEKVIKILQELQVLPKVEYSDYMRAFVYCREDEFYIWFFNFECDAGPHRKIIEFFGKKLELQLGSKTSGVIHIKQDVIISAMVKGVNELEETHSKIGIRFREETLEIDGDGIYWSEF